MKLFKKQIKSVEELRRLKVRLETIRDHTDSDALLPPIKEIRKKKKNSGDDGHLIQTVMKVATASGPLQTALALAGPLLKLAGGRKRKIKAVEIESHKPSWLSKIARDVVVGYLLYKGLQLGVGLLRKYVRRKKVEKHVNQEILKRARR